MHKSLDGGFSWSNYYILPIEDNQNLCGMSWIEGTTNWYFASSTIQNAPIYKSTDNGNNWNAMVIENNSDQIQSISFARNGNRVWGYAATLNGLIFMLAGDLLNTVKIDITGSFIPDKYLLEQNYPNPFNPTTSIKYSVSSIQNVKLTVFNMLGKEVATLVNERQKPGEYEVKFDGTNLPSGVYYYKIVSGDYSEVRKMVLIK
jgi:hypothetical protein